MSKPSEILTVVLWSILGALACLCVPLFPLFRELVRRLMHVASGGVGETAIWTEPLAYIPLMAIHYFFPWGAAGGLLGGFVGWNVMRRSSLSKSQR